VNRRAFVTGLGALLAAPRVAGGEKVRAVASIGFLTPSDLPGIRERFREGLHTLGHVENQTFMIEYRSAHGRFDELPMLASELVRLDVDVIVAFVTQAALAAKRVTPTIPIVMIGVADPVGVGLVASLARPGGNVTGTSSIATDLVGKQFEALKDIVRPSAKVAVLWNPANAVFQAAERKQAEAVGRSLGMRLRFVEVRSDDEVDRAFATVSAEASDAVMVFADPLLAQIGSRITQQATQRHLPSVGALRAYAEAGGLMAYGPNYSDLTWRAAYYVDKILKGAKPADLPVEQPTKFELVINLKTAKALGLTLPPSLLLRADQVIE
jgi:ABC-type uncharacterized transport system substrate-binding protein